MWGEVHSNWLGLLDVFSLSWVLGFARDPGPVPEIDQGRCGGLGRRLIARRRSVVWRGGRVLSHHFLARRRGASGVGTAGPGDVARGLFAFVAIRCISGGGYHWAGLIGFEAALSV